MSLPEKNSYDALGGEMENYQATENPVTDLDAEQSNEMRADLAAMTRTATRSAVKFTIAASAVVISNSDYDAVWGNDISYKPVGTYNSTGNFTITYPAQVVDVRGHTKNINFGFVWCNIGSATHNGHIAKARVSGPNTIVVLVEDSSGAAVNPSSGEVVYLMIM